MLRWIPLGLVLAGCGASFDTVPGSGGAGGTGSASGGAGGGDATGAVGGGAPCTNMALHFDGVDDDLVVPAGLTLNLLTYTVEMWVKSASPHRGGERRLWSYAVNGESGNALLLSQEVTILGYLEARAYNPMQQEAVGRAVPLDTWQHVAMVFDGTELRIYQGGELVNTRNPVTSPVQYDGPLIIGSSNAFNSNHQVYGAIDEVRMSNSARYDANFSPERLLMPDDATVLLFHFDEGAGGRVSDVVGNYEGTLQGEAGTPGGPSFVPAPCE